ncbi:MAG: hypothetical protein EOS36_09990 [Mesorhizobium sp.]|uniref:hypothetical protein n=1 Tax=Mesorhizobium sp. TaxID=1871066 RepID=UPI000FE4E38F|nr:hypothetical protein [Mesorhizobium sp.]RWD64441.1 MAG: hypothetical protein EOS36_09990 [Mesorhizobium sp.]RWE47616.1 MAG: hypothetical protein EOS79_10170 [Mesorhizobium sp.]
MAAMRRHLCDSGLPAPIYAATQKEGRARRRAKVFVMDRGLFFLIGDFLTTFGSAAAASRAVEAGRKPRRSDLKKLGIDPTAFDRIGRF